MGGILLSAIGIDGILGGILIGAGVGSLINGYVTEINGGDFTVRYIGGVTTTASLGTSLFASAEIQKTSGNLRIKTLGIHPAHNGHPIIGN